MFLRSHFRTILLAFFIFLTQSLSLLTPSWGLRALFFCESKFYLPKKNYSVLNTESVFPGISLKSRLFEPPSTPTLTVFMKLNLSGTEKTAAWTESLSVWTAGKLKPKCFTSSPDILKTRSWTRGVRIKMKLCRRRCCCCCLSPALGQGGGELWVRAVSTLSGLQYCRYCGNPRRLQGRDRTGEQWHAVTNTAALICVFSLWENEGKTK